LLKGLKTLPFEHNAQHVEK